MPRPTRERRPGTLMPVRPSSELRGESLSHDGETEVSQGQDAAMGDDSVLAATQSEAADTDGDDDAEEEEVEGEVTEARVAIGRKAPKDPTKKEKEEHVLTHMPFRSWCEDCVKSMAPKKSSIVST